MTTAVARPPRGLLPVVPDTRVRQRLDLRGMILLSALWFGISYLWNPLGQIILPVLINRFIQPTTVHLGLTAFTLDKNTFLALLEGTGAVFAVVWQPAIGALSDRSRFAIGRRRPYIAIGVLGDVVFLTLMAFATSYLGLLLVYAFLQMASNTAQGPYQGMLPDQVPEDQRGQASGYYGGLQMAGLLIGFLLIGVILVPRGQTQLAILSIAAVLAITGAMVVFGMPDVRSTQTSTKPLGREIALSFVLDARRYPDFAWLMVSRLLFLVALGGIFSFVLNFLQDTFRLTESRAAFYTGVLVLLISAIAAVVSTLAGGLSERFGRKRFVAAACVIGAAGALLEITAHSLPVIFAYGVVLGISAGVFLSVDWAFATDLIPKAEAGRYMGVSNIATASSGILARFLLGPIIDIFNNGRTSTVGYRVMFGIGAAFYLLALGTLRPVREIRVE